MNEKLKSRLESYWRLELWSVVLIPGTTLLLCASFGQRFGLFGILPLLVMCALLLVGGGYWYGKARQLDGDSTALQNLLSWASRLQVWLFLCVLVLLLACFTDIFLARFSISHADRWIAVLATLLALAEYINYYHIQLQHFDHLPDFQRLLRGRGFRRSKMSLDLQRYRRGLE